MELFLKYCTPLRLAFKTFCLEGQMGNGDGTSMTCAQFLNFCTKCQIPQVSWLAKPTTKRDIGGHPHTAS